MITIRGRQYPIYYNGAAMLQIIDILQDMPLRQALSIRDVDGLHRVAAIAAVMADQAELVRRYEGREPREVPNAEQIYLFATIDEAQALIPAIVDAINNGTRRDVEEPKSEIEDLGLEQLKKK